MNVQRGPRPIPVWLCGKCDCLMKEDIYDSMQILICESCGLLCGDESDPRCEEKLDDAAKELGSEIVFTPENKKSN